MGLLPGALTRNQKLHFLCEPAPLEVRPGTCQWLKSYGEGEAINLPIAHGEGRYQCDPDELEQLEGPGNLRGPVPVEQRQEGQPFGGGFTLGAKGVAGSREIAVAKRHEREDCWARYR